MLDNERAVIGDNNPPAFDAEVVTGFTAKTEEFLKVTQQWLQLEKVVTEVQATQMTDQIDGLRGLDKKIDTARKDAKKPHDDAGKLVQAAFNPLLAKLKTAADALKPKLAEYAAEKARIEAGEKAKAEEEALEKAKQAEADRMAAEASGDIGALVDAEQQAKAAEEELKEASRKPTTNVKSASGAGRTMSLRTVKEVEVTNVRVLFMHYQDRPEVTELLKRLATADVRSKDYDPEASPIPGIKVTDRKVMG